MPLERIEDLAQPGVRRVAIANPAHAPYGMAAEQALRSAGLWQQLQPKLVFGESVNQAFQFAQTGNVDVGIIALSLAIVAEGGRYRQLPGTVLSIEPRGALRAVSLDCRGLPVLVHVTPRTVAKLRIAEGDEIRAVIKTASCSVLAG